MDYAQRVLTAGPALYLLFPFRLVVRPFLTPDAAMFFGALTPALLIFLLHYLWVINSDVAFEEASVEASQKLATRIAAVRAGNWQATGKKQKAKSPWFKLAPTGPLPTALLWKNLIGVGQIFSLRLWIMLIRHRGAVRGFRKCRARPGPFFSRGVGHCYRVGLFAAAGAAVVAAGFPE